MSMNIEAEIRDLKRRVGELEGSFGFLTQQVKSVHRDVLAFQERTEQRFDGMEKRFDDVQNDIAGVRSDVVGLRGTVSGLAASLPKIIGDAVREANHERDRKR